MYGNPQIAYSLADLQVGGLAGVIVSQRVRFRESGMLSAIRPMMIYDEGGPAGEAYYHNGDGGTFQISIETDDGSSLHLPSGQALGQTDEIIGMPSAYAGSGSSAAVTGGDPGDFKFYRKFTLQSPVQVQANTYYHLVFRNMSADPVGNFVSVDNLYSGTANVPAKTAGATFGGAIMYKRDGRDWITRVEQWPIGEYHFSDGRVFGNGYTEIAKTGGPDRASRYVNPNESVRQVFTPDRTVSVNSVTIGALHVTGANQMTVKLTSGSDANATTLWEGTIGAFPTGTPSGNSSGLTSGKLAEFRGVTLPNLTLQAGQTYALEVTSTGGTHVALGILDASIRYGFSPKVTVDGQAEFRSSPGGPWQVWPYSSTTLGELDMSFYFGLS